MSYRNVRTWIVSTLAVALGLFCVLADPSLDLSAEITVNSRVGSPSLEGVELRPAPVDRIAEATSAGLVPLNLPDRGWVNALRHLNAYEITPSADRPAVDEQYQAKNQAQRLRVGFSPKGIHVVPRGRVEGLRMELSGIGYGDRLERVSDGLLEPSGERIDYHRTTAAGAEFTEWYVNSPKGVEQGFTLPAPPSANQTGQPLVLQLELSGGFEPTLEAGGGAIAFATPDGIGALRYWGLHAYDAGGDELASWMEVRVGSIALVVDDAKARYPVTVDPHLSHETKLTASDAAANDNFGYSVAVDKNTAVVGAPGSASSGPLAVPGSAYVFVRSGTTWTEEAKLTASDAADGDRFGWSVAFSGDTAVIGAPQDFPDFLPVPPDTTGKAYVFQKPATGWADATEDAKLTASDAADGDSFGISVAVSGDTAVVGAAGDDDVTFFSGSAYVFQKPATGWAGNLNEDAKLTASPPSFLNFFGLSVAVSGDNVLVGAAGFEDALIRSGKVYVFERNGATWTQVQKLTASDAAAFDAFGLSIAVSGDTAVFGAEGDDDGGSASGSAYVFVRTVTTTGTTWTEEDKLTASDGAAFDLFGFSVGVSGDTAVVGARFDDDAGNASGSAYVFVRTGTTWTQEDKLTASDADGGDRFGWSVAVSGDTVVVGARRNNDAGSAYVFTTLTPQQAIDLLIAKVQGLVSSMELNPGQANSLIAKLVQAKVQLGLANDLVACLLLQAFINEVDGLVGGGVLTQESRDCLIDQANDIRDQLGC